MEPLESRINATAALEHLDWVRGLARSLVRDANLADDITQEAWLAVLRRPAAEGVVSRGWLAWVVRNAVRQENRRTAIRREHEERARLRDETASTDELVDRVHTQRMVVDAVLALNTPYQRVILLRYFEGLAPSEIARRQGIPVATVKTRLRRGLGQVREALDKRHGGDRDTWMSALTALAAPTDSGVGIGTLVIGGMALGTISKVSAAVLVAAACVYFATRTPPAESPRMTATVEPPATDVKLVDAELVPSAEDPATEAERRSLVVEEPPARVAAARGTNVLRVVLEGITEANARMARVTLTGVDQRNEWPVEIRGSWPCQGLTSEFDLDPFLARVAELQEDLHVDELEVEVDHPLHLPEWTRVPLSRGVGLAGSQSVYEVRVRLVSAAVIDGRLVREDGAPAAEGLVGALRLEGDFPIEAEGRAVECAADGAFELRVPASGRYALASYEEGRRPTTTRVEALVGTRVDVGTLVLEPGHRITGYAMRRGAPLVGATVSATQLTHFTDAAPEDVVEGMHASVYEGRNFITPVRSMHFLWLSPSTGALTEWKPRSRRNGRFELAEQRVQVDENGAFAFGGLAPDNYLLRMRELLEVHDALRPYWDYSKREEGMVDIHGDLPALAVRAPEHGVVLEFHWTSIHFELEGDFESEDAGRLILRFKTNAPEPPPDLDLEGLSVAPEYLTADFPLSGGEPTYVLQAPPLQHFTGDVTFPGRQPALLEFTSPEPGGELVVPVRLVRSEEEATLVIELETPPADVPETFTIKLWRAGRDMDPPATTEVEVAEGRMRVEGLFPGTYRVVVLPGQDRYYASGLFFENEFDVELRPGLEATRSILLREGAGMRVTVRGEDGELVSGEYELFDDAGRPASLVLGTDASISSWTFDSNPTHTSLNPFEPGRYRLVLRSAGYAERSVTVELRAGEYEDIDVTLSK